MSKTNWIEHRREDDEELIGFIERVGEDAYVPKTLFGYSLGSTMDEFDAMAVLDGLGLSYLADPWQLQIEGRAETIKVKIAEVTLERVVVTNADYGFEGDIGHPFVLEIPTDRLTPA